MKQDLQLFAINLMFIEGLQKLIGKIVVYFEVSHLVKKKSVRTDIGT